MIAALCRFFRRDFRPHAKAVFLDLFKSHTNLNRAIVLEETSPLSGTVTTYQWQEFPESCRLVIWKINLKKKTQRAIAERDLPKTEVANVIHGIEEAGGESLGNFSGKVIDGVFYTLCWGNLSHSAGLSIRNPQFGSERHQQLITMLKKRATEIPQ